MKAMKRLFALLLALTMVFGLAVTAFASDEASGNSGTGKIQITNPAPETTYNAYRLLAVESWNGDKVEDGPPETAEDGNYSYKLAGNEWDNFFKNDAYAKKFFTIDADNYVSFKKTADDNSTFDAAFFAQTALAFGKNFTVDATATTGTVPANDEDGKLDSIYLKKDGSEELPLGYYLVDTTMGALCSLGTTDKIAEIKEKQLEPEIDKDIEGETDEENELNIGDPVNFVITVTAQEGADRYIVHDKMDDGLTFDATKTDGKTAGIDSVEIDYDDSRATKSLTEGATEYGFTLTSDVDHNNDQKADHTFDITFTEDALKSLKANDKIIIKYHAVLNENAEIGAGDDKNKNETYLEYGDGHETEPQYTITETFEFNVVKFHDANNNDTVDTGETLANAKFKLYTDFKEDGDILTGEVDVVPFDTTDLDGYDANTKYYKVCTLDHTGETNPHTHQQEITTVAHGKFNIRGLDAGDYYLFETAAPDGYNKLQHPIRVYIDDEGVVSFTKMVKDTVSGNWSFPTENNPNSADKTLNVENNTGNELPATGGIGTTLFYVIGGIMVIGAAVILITKKRVNM